MVQAPLTHNLVQAPLSHNLVVSRHLLSLTYAAFEFKVVVLQKLVRHVILTLFDHSIKFLNYFNKTIKMSYFTLIQKIQSYRNILMTGIGTRSYYHLIVNMYIPISITIKSLVDLQDPH